MNNGSNLKDTITTIFAILMVIAGAVNAFLQANTGNDTINWYQLVVAVVIAVVAYFTGKNPNGTTKAIDPKTGQQEIPAKADQK
jgi:uncharacterized membrane protein YfcA